MRNIHLMLRVALFHIGLFSIPFAQALPPDSLFDGALNLRRETPLVAGAQAVSRAAGHMAEAGRNVPAAPPQAPVNLYATLPGGKPVRPDERFHLQAGEPKAHIWRLGPLRRVSWEGLVNEDGSPGTFVSWSLWGFQLYHGSVKCDGSRTYALRQGQLGGSEEERRMFVMTTTPKEKFAFRHHPPAEVPTWDNMGGS